MGGRLLVGDVVAGGEVSTVVGLGLVDSDDDGGAVTPPPPLHAVSGAIASRVTPAAMDSRVVIRFTESSSSVRGSPNRPPTRAASR